jgi:hypothetical protein
MAKPFNAITNTPWLTSTVGWPITAKTTWIAPSTGWDEAIRLIPDDAEAYYYRGIAYDEKGDQEMPSQT